MPHEHETINELRQWIQLGEWMERWPSGLRWLGAAAARQVRWVVLRRIAALLTRRTLRMTADLRSGRVTVDEALRGWHTGIAHASLCVRDRDHSLASLAELLEERA